MVVVPDRLLSAKRYDDSDNPTNNIAGLVDLLQLTQPHSVIEVGSYNGVSSEVLALFSERVVCVEPALRPAFVDVLCRYPNIEWVYGLSPSTLERFKVGEFEMCYIDRSDEHGEHHYSAAIEDITACKRVVKVGGWIAGHDFAAPGVRQAVLEMFGRALVFADTSWLVRNGGAIDLK